jgi:hypothetical protein
MKLARLATLPQTRRLVVAAARSTAFRELTRRVRTDRAGLARDLRDPRLARGLINDLRDPASTVAFVREAIHHPVTAELTNVGLVLLPSRYLPAGWATTWLARRVLRRTRRAAKPGKVRWS